jgi:hypothetical protein
MTRSLDTILRAVEQMSLAKLEIDRTLMRIDGHDDMQADTAWLGFAGYDASTVIPERTDYGFRELDGTNREIVGLQFWQASQHLAVDLLAMLSAPDSALVDRSRPTNGFRSADRGSDVKTTPVDVTGATGAPLRAKAERQREPLALHPLDAFAPRPAESGMPRCGWTRVAPAEPAAPAGHLGATAVSHPPVARRIPERHVPRRRTSTPTGDPVGALDLGDAGKLRRRRSGQVPCHACDDPAERLFSLRQLLGCLAEQRHLLTQRIAAVSTDQAEVVDHRSRPHQQPLEFCARPDGVKPRLFAVN